MADVSYWHGGQRGLLIGGRILPPARSGATGTLLDTAKEAGLATPATADKVYVTTSREAALMYACVHPSRGWVYRVTPVGPLTPDPDCTEPSLSWECSEAVVEEFYVPTRREFDMVLAVFQQPTPGDSVKGG